MATTTCINSGNGYECGDKCFFFCLLSLCWLNGVVRKSQKKLETDLRYPHKVKAKNRVKRKNQDKSQCCACSVVCWVLLQTLYYVVVEAIITRVHQVSNV